MEKVQGLHYYYINKFQESCSTWWHRSYAVDWGVSIALFAVVHGITFFLEPLDRFLPVNDPSVGYPSLPDIVPTSALFILSTLLPWIAIGLIQIRHRSSHDFHHASLALIATILFTTTVTTALKYAAGRYRPNYMANSINDGKLSFPSGHSSMSFAGMTFLSLYLLGKFKLYHTDHTSSFAKSVLMVSPMTIAFFVALSRTIDYHHNYSDIIAGGLIGVAVAYLVYFMYYPPLHSHNSHKPKLHKDLVPATVIELTEVKVGNPVHPSKSTVAIETVPAAGVYSDYSGKVLVEPITRE